MADLYQVELETQRSGVLAATMLIEIDEVTVAVPAGVRLLFQRDTALPGFTRSEDYIDASAYLGEFLENRNGR